MKLQRLQPTIREVSLSPTTQQLEESASAFSRSSTAHLRLRGRALQTRNARIAARDCFTCRICGRVTAPRDGQVDHRSPLALGGTDEDGNLQWICTEPCHRLKTERENAQMRRSSECP
jgi:5-methylcytosine-specific restriction endonuclease McrA